ncbi:6998_t:CDS:2 [Racocetra fulgida]|uniref:6998_t:CDS:1 n=1 Tax=Racocetra fulgida TaxID=60492 RepID=A0A9N8VYA4_9GLOM|nr:6998_t:CDS:2 [Racocetra fulgida]
MPSQTDKNEYDTLFELYSALKDENEQLKNKVKQLENQLICLQSLTNNKSILIVGAGGLGAPAALYLAAAGVGNELLCQLSYFALRAKGIPHVLIDVREPVQFDICNLPGSLSKGNDSQLAVQALKKTLQGEIKDVIGGLYRWAKDIDREFPIY